MAALPKLLFADPTGNVMEHPHLVATVRSGEELLPANRAYIELPRHSRLVHLPGRLPVGADPGTGELELVREMKIGSKSFVPTAVGVLLPPGYTRVFLPGEVKSAGPVLPQWAYTATAWDGRRAVTWAVRTDRRHHWNPERYSTTSLSALVSAHRARFPHNRVLAQLETCALAYRCFTSQNIFYTRDEGAIPASVFCNAHCVGCISEQPKGGAPASHLRLDDGPAAEEMADVGAYHLAHATGRTMISFGQGCEGEPLTRHRAIARSIRLIRRRTTRGSININTNGSLPHAMAELLDAGLDAIRVSLNSAVEDLYAAYYKPVGYQLTDVEESIEVARHRGAYIALNLLLFPGVTDRSGEVQALQRLVCRHRIDQVQTRSLCIDPVQYLDVARSRGAGGKPIGIQGMLGSLQRAAPWLTLGNFARGLNERRGRHAVA